MSSMSHPRAGQTVFASADSVEAGRSNTELQEVRPFTRADLHPPKTRPFTGIPDHHRCLLPPSHSRQSFPTSYQIPRQTAPDSRIPPKRHSSGFQNPERGHVPLSQNPQRRHSSSSQKLRSGGPPYPYCSGQMAEKRRQQINGVPVSSSHENAVPSNKNSRPDRSIESPQRQTKQMEPSSRTTIVSQGEGVAAEITPAKLPAIKHFVAEDAKTKASHASGFSGASSSNDENPDGLLQKSGNNYDHLHTGSSTSHHLYRPIAENPNVRPGKADFTNPDPSKSAKPKPGATSPVYDSVGVCTKQVRPESHPFLPPKRNQLDENADDIIELQTDVKSRTSPEEKQNKSNSKKEEPEILEIPNTNFAIACMVALCFNLPLGVLAMYFSLKAVKAFQDGSAKLGEKRSRWSIVMSLLGITITTVIVSSVVLYTAIQGQKRISRHKAYGTQSGPNF